MVEDDEWEVGIDLRNAESDTPHVSASFDVLICCESCGFFSKCLGMSRRFLLRMPDWLTCLEET